MLRRPLILAYHAVSSTWPSTLAVSEHVLEQQVAFLHTRGFVSLTLSEAERRRRENELPDRSVVVTFDDGYASTLRALPILSHHGFVATVSVVTKFVGGAEPLSWPGIDEWLHSEFRPELTPASWNELGELADAGWEIGSHTHTHPLLPRLDDSKLNRELADSRAAITARLGSCTSLAYPYGIADGRVADAARRAGYDVATTLTFVELSDEPWRRPRTSLTRADVGMRLRVKISAPTSTARRTRIARAARRLPRRRSWLPE